MSRHSEAIAALLSRPPFPDLRAVAAAHDAPVLCVGGAVRDALLGREPADIDLAVGGDLDAFVELFVRRCGRRPVSIGDAWRDTRRTSLQGVQVDVGVLLGDERKDLAARDFTINAMAVPLSGRDPRQRLVTAALIDPFDGVGDLGRRSIRRVSLGALVDDPLRMLRAVRYIAVLDGFHLDDATHDAIRESVTLIAASAAERVQTEWAHLLAAPGWAAGLRLALELDLVQRTLGFAVTMGGADAWDAWEARHPGSLAAGALPRQRLAAVIAGTPGLRPETAGDALAERRWPHRATQRVARLAGWARALEANADTVSWVLQDRECAAHAALLARALVGGDEAVAARITALELHAARAAEEPWVRGSDLLSWGLDEGPQLGELLQQAARGQLERRWTTAAAARSWARCCVAAANAGAGH